MDFQGLLSKLELTVSKDSEKSPPFSHTLYNSQNPLNPENPKIL